MVAKDFTVRLISRPFLGGVANNSSITIPKDVTIWGVPNRGPDFDAPGVPKDVYTLRVLAGRHGKLCNVMVLREISDETAEDWLNGKTDDLMTNERKNITQPSDWWEAFEQAAKAEGMTLAAWIGEAAKEKLPPKIVKKLSTRPPANRPKKNADDETAKES